MPCHAILSKIFTFPSSADRGRRIGRVGGGGGGGGSSSPGPPPMGGG